MECGPLRWFHDGSHNCVCFGRNLLYCSRGYTVSNVFRQAHSCFASHGWVLNAAHSFLAPSVGEIGPIKLDGLPFAFKRDLLLHEAHRHPFSELFGLLCLLKLRCCGAVIGDNTHSTSSSFGTRAHASWRLLAVLTLMPWLKKYRPINHGRRSEHSNDNLVMASNDGEQTVASKSLPDLPFSLQDSQRRNRELEKQVHILSSQVDSLLTEIKLLRARL